ncbi:MAG: phosphoglyceromutase [Candidatus Dormibacteraeota bacterium]|uniref:2,3-bisphosphoglycerate-dependent phosphoglycerate mutase n=1 Tax=Candidatus Dormiibacter inghamiae TaxID=3127013 RepID=A0A934NI27_9BACT|nr:phosphoglyceromutase [Candidatus Dormibacteraeota bacterium]MBJ7604814.1 phosphoglyceromutase [Candidatus Dormibacteraeota bacterium]
MSYCLILLRHGQSEWNARDLFTGWVDIGLTKQGQAEAVRGGQLLRERGLLPEIVHTSVLRRAIHTSDVALQVCDRHWIPVRRSWRLNERHYGALQGKDKAQTLAQYGEQQFQLWRRSYDQPPPPLVDDDEFSQARDPRYAHLPPELRPRTECLKDVLMRLLPYWYESIVPDLQTRRVVLLAAHGNSLRALLKHLDQIGDQDIAGVNIPTGIPLVYELDSDFRPAREGGEYLDPEAAASSIEAVKNQGRSQKGGSDPRSG